MQKEDGLRNKNDWNDIWRDIGLPAEIKRERDNHLINRLLDIFDEKLPRDSTKSILEIGGAPGQYLAYFAKNHGYVVTGMDYSDTGCEKMKENFRILGIGGHVYQMDLFKLSEFDHPIYDVVCSLGFIEHFENLDMVIEKHLELLKPGGTLIIGAPNFTGFNGIVLKHTAPLLMSQHNTENMNIGNWANFKRKFNLEAIFEGYVGGFQPRIIICQNKTIFNYLLYYVAMSLRIVTDNVGFLSRYNSRHWSAYVLGIYRKPTA